MAGPRRLPCPRRRSCPAARPREAAPSRAGRGRTRRCRRSQDRRARTPPRRGEPPDRVTAERGHAGASKTAVQPSQEQLAVALLRAGRADDDDAVDRFRERAVPLLDEDGRQCVPQGVSPPATSSSARSRPRASDDSARRSARAPGWRRCAAETARCPAAAGARETVRRCRLPRRSRRGARGRLPSRRAPPRGARSSDHEAGSASSAARSAPRTCRPRAGAARTRRSALSWHRARVPRPPPFA